MSGGMQAGAGQLVEGRDEQGAEASAGARVGEVDWVRSHGWCVSVGSPSPAGTARSFFFGAVLLIVCTRIAPACLVMVRVGRE
ncbi:hypothetical protein [Actinomyces naeslundii]|uniref:hypothetical protein n=1 Tax=Actinomyces naeslundii TaxID=1655 RepID=UPI0011784189|nr:hypothetical protein [Actinomyces naeslundii]